MKNFLFVLPIVCTLFSCGEWVVETPIENETEVEKPDSVTPDTPIDNETEVEELDPVIPDTPIDNITEVENPEPVTQVSHNFTVSLTAVGVTAAESGAAINVNTDNITSETLTLIKEQ